MCTLYHDFEYALNQRISKQRKQRQTRLYQRRTGPFAAQEAWLENVSPSTAGRYLAAKGLCWRCTSIGPRDRVAWFMPDFKAYNASINLLVPPFAYQAAEDDEISDAMLSSSNHDHQKRSVLLRSPQLPCYPAPLSFPSPITSFFHFLPVLIG